MNQSRQLRGIQPATLGDLADQGLDVWAWCNGCFHHAVLPIGPLVERLGHGYPVPAARDRTYCATCGSRDVETRPNWPAMGVTARHTLGEFSERP